MCGFVNTGEREKAMIIGRTEWVLALLLLEAGCAVRVQEGDTSDRDRDSDPVEEPVACALPGEGFVMEHATRVVLSSWYVTHLISTKSSLSFGVAADLAGGFSTVTDVHLIDFCDEPNSFDPTCDVSGLDGLSVCFQPTCDGPMAATITTWIEPGEPYEPSDAEEPFAYSLEEMLGVGGQFNYLSAPVSAWEIDPAEAEDDFHMIGRTDGDVVWSDGAERLDLSYRVHVETDRVGGEVGAISGEIAWPHLETGHTWSVVFVDSDDGLAGELFRDGEAVAALVDILEGQGDHLHWSMGVEWPEDCP